VAVPRSTDPTDSAAVTFTWSQPRRVLVYYLIGSGVFSALGSVIIFTGGDPADFPHPVSGGLEYLLGVFVWLALLIWLSHASVRADARGIRTQAVLIRFIPAADIVDIHVGGVPHGYYRPYPIAPYVYRRYGRAVKLTPMERLDFGHNSEVLEAECRQLRTAVGLREAAAPAGPPAGWYGAPDVLGKLRWWNGHTWTADTLPIPG
jgi:hypothetical protein